MPPPRSLKTLSETRFASGAAPPYEPALAATPATNVPWPRPSARVLDPSDVKSTCVSSRLPNCLFELSTPESTIAIVAACSRAS